MAASQCGYLMKWHLSFGSAVQKNFWEKRSLVWGHIKFGKSVGHLRFNGGIDGGHGGLSTGQVPGVPSFSAQHSSCPCVNLLRLVHSSVL